MNNFVFYRTHEHECSYLPDQKARTLFLSPDTRPTPEINEALGLVGFRRSGDHIYRPDCMDCQQCLSCRIVVSQFVWKRSFRRILKKNSDIQIQIVKPLFSDEHYNLYSRYLELRHQDGDMYPPSPEHYHDFLVSDQPQARFVEYRRNGQLVATTVIDWFSSGPSAIYTYFEPELEPLSPGTLAILTLIRLAQAHGLPFVYLGYWIKDSVKMNYKTRFQPLEVFLQNQWQLLKNIDNPLKDGQFSGRMPRL
ncbi:arginyltransferase [Gynuella sp.]|uniref:arginyltransferase n=1 Tax=Gynuella sp. TaxID=2969146 RepID=UPI003D09C354